MKTRLSKEWAEIIEKSKHPPKIVYKKDKDTDWMFKAMGWKKNGRRS